MLPTKQSNLTLYENKLTLAKGNHYGILDKMIPQHIYIIDDSVIKEPCYAYCKSTNTIQWLSEIQVKVLKKDNWSKVIASTDKSLNLSSPSEQFIQKYVELYNKGAVISEINVEYEAVMIYDTPDVSKIHNKGTSFVINEQTKNIPHELVLKVDSKNLVTITRCKDSYSKEEVTELFEKFVDQKYPLLYPFLKENL